MSVPVTELQRALRLRAAARFPEALASLDDLVGRFPAWAEARAARGLVLCHLQRFEEGLAELRSAVSMQPRNADFLSDLGYLAFVDARVEEASGAFEAALAVAPAHAAALANLSLVRRAQGDFRGAEAAARAALAADPARYEARINLAYALLAQGRFAEAWPEYAARPAPHVNLRDPHLDAIVPHATRLPAAPAPVVVHGEQGLGDTLFFLRFVPGLRARGHRLAFWGDARLHPLAAASGVFEHVLRADAVPAEGLCVVWAGDLPALLQAEGLEALPPPLAIPADARQRERLRTHLAGLGPAPYIGITWRAGLERRGRIALAKSLDAELLGAALRGVRGTFVSLQRAPLAGELARLGGALGVPVHDAAAANERLEDAFALADALDEYVAVSNTNVHLRASAGRPARVLVPWPPEWRWLQAGESPWFPGTSVYRQAPDGAWGAALARLAADLGASAGG